MVYGVWFRWCQVLCSENHQRNADVELQQRSVEYMQLTQIATTDVLVSCRLSYLLFTDKASV